MATPRPSFVCASCARALRALHLRSQPTRTYIASTSEEQLPRWKQTPPAMKMPMRIRPLTKQPVWRTNEDPELLDRMYDRMVGRAGEAARGQEVRSTRGRDLLPEELKWLAITHKSFDQGRRGFNDRLAFLGKRIVDLQTSLKLLDQPTPPNLFPPETKNQVFKHPSLEGVENVTVFARAAVLERTRLAGLAKSYGLDRVVRWKPKKSDNLEGSGQDTILAHAMYSIVGAMALERGGEVAASIARERILQPLGLR